MKYKDLYPEGEEKWFRNQAKLAVVSEMSFHEHLSEITDKEVSESKYKDIEDGRGWDILLNCLFDIASDGK